MSWIDKIKSKASIKKDSANTDLWSESSLKDKQNAVLNNIRHH